jgi:hypothetical protein
LDDHEKPISKDSIEIDSDLSLVPPAEVDGLESPERKTKEKSKNPLVASPERKSRKPSNNV